MTSPMRAPGLHDTLVLLDGSKRWPVPGVSRVTVTLAANVDTQATPGAGTAATQLNEATADIEVQVQMWTHEQWTAYQSLLTVLRRGTKAGPAVFTSAHPEITARRVKRLYFVSETPQPYSPATGYRTSLKFSERLKDKAQATAIGGEQLVIPGATGGTVGGTPAATASTAKGQAVAQAAAQTLIGPPAPADGGRANTAMPGYCSAWVRVAATKAGMDPKLFGASALATEGNFKRAGLSQPWNADSLRTLEPGDIVFWANDPSGFGHTGIVVGRDKDGMPLIAGNNLVTAKQTGGKDARGIVRLDQLSTANSQPTSVGKPGGVPKAPVVQGPAYPVGVPGFAPSNNVPGPR